MRISDWSSDVCSSDLVEGLLAPRPDNGQLDARSRSAAHPLHCIVQCAAIDKLTVQMRDVVARLYASAICWRALRRGDDLDRAILHRHRQPKPPISAIRLRPKIFEIPRIEKARMRIKAGRSEEHTSELQSLMRISYAAFCLTKKKLTDSITAN